VEARCNKPLTADGYCPSNSKVSLLRDQKEGVAGTCKRPLSLPFYTNRNPYVNNKALNSKRLSYSIS